MGRLELPASRPPDVRSNQLIYIPNDLALAPKGTANLSLWFVFINSLISEPFAGRILLTFSGVVPEKRYHV